MLMARQGGALNTLNPREPMDKNLYDLPPAKLPKIRPFADLCAIAGIFSKPMFRC